ncbi:MAG TPA: M85 family metallopeptidase [Arsenophonus nasoniae]|uniref:M85 family metallopeptidase n=1 Tax=Arsenophonus nasoniae TaxID=638 RepID=UPI003879BD2D
MNPHNPEQTSRDPHYDFRNRDTYAEYVIQIGRRYPLSDDQINNIITNVRASIRLSYGFLADFYTAYNIEYTIRGALLESQTFRDAVAFSLSEERYASSNRESDTLNNLYYTNLYVMRDDNDDRRIDQLRLTEDIFEHTHETVPIVASERAFSEHEEDYSQFVSFAMAPNDISSSYYHFWQQGLMHEIIHIITDAEDPNPEEENSRLGPTEILANRIVQEMGLVIPVFQAYAEEERETTISRLSYQTLRDAINRHYERAYALLERLYEISIYMASPDFRGIDTLSPHCVYHTSDEDTPESWRVPVFLDNSPPEPPEDLPPRSPDEDTRGCCWPFFSGASATSDSNNFSTPTDSINLFMLPDSNNIFATKYENIIFENKLPLRAFDVEKYNLVIAAMAVNRVEEGGGFYKEKYNSWKEWYQDHAWRKVLFGKGITDHGFDQANGTFMYNPYGFIFYDGSFAVGVTGNDVEDVVNSYGYIDNWTTLSGKNWSPLNILKYAGQIYFDKSGRPVAIVMSNTITGFFGTGWSFIYNKGKWEYESKDDWDERRFAGRTESLDPYAPRFLIKNT